MKNRRSQYFDSGFLERSNTIAKPRMLRGRGDGLNRSDIMHDPNFTKLRPSSQRYIHDLNAVCILSSDNNKNTVIFRHQVD